MECSFCQKAFSKGEHLRRHERSHTGAKPYVCRECNRSFSRQDSLARHEKLHARRRATRDAASPSPLVDKPVTPESVQSIDPSEENGSEFSSAARSVVPGSASTTTHPPPVTQSVDLDFDLIWPDSEDLFQTIMSSDAANQWQIPLGTLPFSASPSASEGPFGTPRSFDHRPASIGSIPSGGNHQAVQDVSKMISNLSSSVTAAAKSTSITSVFLDECLHMFFVKFIPTFPVLHRATFVFRECSHPLLLNAIAIGSLYLGPKDAVAKGEALWRLAHTAIATSWQNLITHRGPYDACDGVQLVVTGLLSQVYGVLSRNRAIRSTSQAFHTLGFVWARRCGMFDCEPFPINRVPPLDAPEAEKELHWRLWVAREIQHRALLAHYMLDGLISQMFGEPTSVRHSTNSLGFPSCEAAFEAGSADEWITAMRSHTFDASSFRTILHQLFRRMGEPRLLTPSLSAFSYKVILEGLQSLISDDASDEGSAVGVPTKSEVRKALTQVYESITLNAQLSSADRLETLLRWHAICLDIAVDSSVLCRNLCARYDITQHIWRNGPSPRNWLDLCQWAITSDARIALLHAMAIQEIVEELPRGRAHAIHMPSSLFAAATVYSVFAIAGQPAVKIPGSVIWQDVLSDPDPYVSLTEIPHSTLNDSDTTRYVRGESLCGSATTARNLLYELNSMQKLFRCLISQWGVACDMESVIEQWISLCH